MNKGKFIGCRLRVVYSDGEKSRETFVSVKEASDKNDRIKAIESIKDYKALITYWIEDVYEKGANSFRIQFNHLHQPHHIA
jgi:hypothetical protein